MALSYWIHQADDLLETSGLNRPSKPKYEAKVLCWLLRFFVVVPRLFLAVLTIACILLDPVEFIMVNIQLSIMVFLIWSVKWSYCSSVCWVICQDFVVLLLSLGLCSCFLHLSFSISPNFASFFTFKFCLCLVMFCLTSPVRLLSPRSHTYVRSGLSLCSGCSVSFALVLQSTFVSA